MIHLFFAQDLGDIQAKTKNLSEAAGFPDGARPLFYCDVIAPGTAINPSDYYYLGVFKLQFKIFDL